MLAANQVVEIKEDDTKEQGLSVKEGAILIVQLSTLHFMYQMHQNVSTYLPNQLYIAC